MRDNSEVECGSVKPDVAGSTPAPAAKKGRGKDLAIRSRKSDIGKAANRLARILKLRFSDGLSYQDIAKLMGDKNHESIRQLCIPFNAILENPEAVKAFKTHEADFLDGIRLLMAQGMYEQLSDPERRKTLDLSRLTYGFGVLYDKMRLERGESTTNVMTLSDLVKQAHAKDVTPEQEAEVVESDPT